MTDNGHTDHEQLARQLHEQGQAQAPADLAGDVMRQVRAEPRRREREWLRPVALSAALATLEPEFRAAVVACDIIGMGMDEAAAALEVPAGTVKSRLHRGRSRLAVELEAHRTS